MFKPSESSGFTFPETVNKAARDALYPLSLPAKYVEKTAADIVEPPPDALVELEKSHGGPLEFERSKDYPSAKYTDPTIMDFGTIPFAEKPLVMASKGITRLIRPGAKTALEEFIARKAALNALPAQTELALGITERKAATRFPEDMVNRELVPSGSKYADSQGRKFTLPEARDKFMNPDLPNVGNEVSTAPLPPLPPDTPPRLERRAPPLPVMPEDTTGTPYALFDYNDPITGKASYKIYGDAESLGYKTTPNVPLETVKEKGVPVIGRTQKSIKLGHEPPPLTVQPGEERRAATIQPELPGTEGPPSFRPPEPDRGPTADLPSVAFGPIEDLGVDRRVPPSFPFTLFPLSASRAIPVEEEKQIQLSRKDILEINKKGGTNLPVPEKPPFQRQLFKDLEEGAPSAPISLPPAESLPPGSAGRLAAFAADDEGPDIPKVNFLMARSEVNQKLGAAQEAGAKQWHGMNDSKGAATEEALNLQYASKKKYDLKIGSPEEKAFEVYVQTPNKMEAYAQLKAIDPALAIKMKAKDEYMRSVYDSLLPRVNKVRAQNGLKPIPYRYNYMPHMQETNLLEKLGLADKVGTPEGAALVQKVLKEQAGDPLYTRVRDVVFRHAEHQGDTYNVGPVRAFDQYVNSALNYIHMQPHVNELNALAEATQATKPILSKYFRNQADHIAGKVEPLDAVMKDLITPDVFNVVAEMQRRAVRAVVQGNPSVGFTQLSGLLPPIGKYPTRDLIAGFGKILDPEMRAFARQNSAVLRDRANDLLRRTLHAGPVSKQLDRIGAAIDYEVANYNWLTAYSNGIRKKLPLGKAISEAEHTTAIAQGFSSPTETRPLMRPKTTQAVLPLQNSQVAFARAMAMDIWKDKTLSEKGLAAARISIAMSALTGMRIALFNEKKDATSMVDLIPLSGIFKGRTGGPLASGIGNILAAKSSESKIKAFIKAAFLVQNRIPAGGMVGKWVADLAPGGGEAPARDRNRDQDQGRRD